MEYAKIILRVTGRYILFAALNKEFRIQMEREAVQNELSSLFADNTDSHLKPYHKAKR
jgi:hypothetical protein